MAFTFTIDPVTPGNNDLVSLGAANIREFKGAVIERLASVFTNINADPMVLKTGIATTGAMTVGNTLTVTTGGLTVSAGTTAVQALTATTGTFSGIISSTATGAAFQRTGATTSAAYFQILNNGSNAVFGAESSAGGSIFAGTTAYAVVLGSATAIPIQLVTNNVVRMTIDTTGIATFSSNVLAGAGSVIGFTGRSIITSPSDGAVNITNNAGSVAASLTIGAITNTVAGIAVNMVPGADGTYGTSKVMAWYRADGTTPRTYLGYGSNNDQTFSLATQETGGQLRFYTGNNTLALTISSAQAATFEGGVTVAAGTSALQAITGTTLVASSNVTVNGYLALKGAADATGAGASDLRIGNGLQSTVGAAGGSSALPATPLGYIQGFSGGLAIVIPYYNA